jgi:hypothetical protein
MPKKKGKKTLRKTAIFSTKTNKKQSNKTAWNSQNLIEFFAWNVQTI